VTPADGAGPPPSLEATGLGWTYAGRPRPAIEGLTFRVEPGRLLLVLGPSGSGKSTLARAVAGLVPHVLPGRWQGSLRIGEREVERTPARYLGREVGLVFQDPDNQLVMSAVDDEVAFGLENRGWPRAAMVERVPQALAQVGLAGFERRITNTLSGGEKQRLAIADVVAAGPGVLVFDEPTANLDPPGMHATLEQIAALAAGRRHTIVLIEHRLEPALPLADDVLLIDENGRQLAFGPAGGVGPREVELLERSGSWVPRAWLSRRRPRPERGGQSEPPRAGRTATMPILAEVRDLRIEYPADESGPRRALDAVSLAAHAGERIALVGPNGAGKSSLLLALAGLLRPIAGTVRVGLLPGGNGQGEELRNPARLRADEISARIGLVFQDPELGFVARTAGAEVMASALAAGSPRAASLSGANAVLERFGLAHLADQPPFELSQGEQRRLSLAALALRPPALMLLDEPTFGLDRRGTVAVLALLDELRSTGQAQLLATHDPRLLPACDRVVALEGGRVVFDGSPEAFLSAPPYVPSEPWRDWTDAAVAS
jgi:energy-coupling factor transport system ATP-binding protein